MAVASGLALAGPPLPPKSKLIKMESHIYLKLIDGVTKYFEKTLSHRQMMT